jgi:hypothetical protein
MSEERSPTLNAHTALPFSLPLLARMLRNLSPNHSELSQGASAGATDSEFLSRSGNPEQTNMRDPAHPHMDESRPHMSIDQRGSVPGYDAIGASSYTGRGLSAGDATPSSYGSPPLRRAG